MDQVYNSAAEYLEHLELSPSELTKAVIGTVGDLDQPLLPEQQALLALRRHMSTQSPESRQRRRDEILATTAADVKRFGERLGSTTMHSAVFGSKGSYEGSASRGQLKLFSNLF